MSHPYLGDQVVGECNEEEDDEDEKVEDEEVYCGEENDEKGVWTAGM